MESEIFAAGCSSLKNTHPNKNVKFAVKEMVAGQCKVCHCLSHDVFLQDVDGDV